LDRPLLLRLRGDLLDCVDVVDDDCAVCLGDLALRGRIALSVPPVALPIVLVSTEFAWTVGDGGSGEEDDGAVRRRRILR
jgi:hypothetical protein